jgi:hypothetical protein
MKQYNKFTDLQNRNFYRVKFNEGLQKFIMLEKEPLYKLEGWSIISDNMMVSQLVLFQCFLDRNKPKKFTTEYVKKSIREWEQFCFDICEIGFDIGVPLD